MGRGVVLERLELKPSLDEVLDAGYYEAEIRIVRRITPAAIFVPFGAAPNDFPPAMFTSSARPLSPSPDLFEISQRFLRLIKREDLVDHRADFARLEQPADFRELPAVGMHEEE